MSSHDPIGSMAGLDAAAGERLLMQVESGAAEVQGLLETLERRVERALSGGRRREGSAGSVDAGGEVGGGVGGEGEAKPLKRVRRVMVKCCDELDQTVLLAELRAAGFKVKRAEAV